VKARLVPRLCAMHAVRDQGALAAVSERLLPDAKDAPTLLHAMAVRALRTATFSPTPRVPCGKQASSVCVLSRR
jgi:hypothetical protein